MNLKACKWTDEEKLLKTLYQENR